MESSSIPIAGDSPDRRSGNTVSRLSGSFLLIVRIFGGLLITLTLVVFCASIPVYFTHLQTPCAGPTCSYGQLTSTGAHTLEMLSISRTHYAMFGVVRTVVLTLVWFLIGGMLAWRKSRDWMALLTTIFLFTLSANLNNNLDVLVAVSSAWNFPVACVSYTGAISLLLVFYLFPDGSFVPRWTRWLFIVFAIGYVPSVFFPGSPFDLRELSEVLSGLIWFGLLASLVFAQIFRYRHVSHLIQRQQTKWVVFGSSVALLIIIALALPPLFSSSLAEQGAPYILLINAVYPFIGLLIPLSFGIAILHYRLWDIDIIISRTLVYVSLTTCVVGIYILVVGYVGNLFHAGDNLLISLIATGLVAVLFQPLRELLQTGINRLLYGQRDEPYTVITELSQRLEATLAPEALLPTIVETVASALKLPYAAIWLGREEMTEVVASYGNPVRDVLVLPLSYQGEKIGRLHLAPRSPGANFSLADRRLLENIARHAGLAAHAVCLTADLQRSRERIVTAREEERRRLRRDLHDGLGATLAALHLQAGATRMLMRQNLAAAESALLDIQSEIRTAIADIRRLVYALRPPMLDELGLVEAIRQSAAQYEISPEKAEKSGEGFSVVVEAPEPFPPLSAAVEVAAYRIVQEALTNVLRHAQARSCRVCFSLLASHFLKIEIADDGVGLPKERQMGMGLISMCERAEEVGGSCAIKPAMDQGTSVLVHLPLLPRKE